MQTQTETFRYRMKSTGASSAKFGPCEVCGEHVTEVYLQVEERPKATTRKTFWTQEDCSDLFGHEECLLEKRR